MDRHRNGSTIRVLHDVVAAADPSHGKAGSFQYPRRWTDLSTQVGLTRNLAKHVSFKEDTATICVANIVTKP